MSEKNNDHPQIAAHPPLVFLSLIVAAVTARFFVPLRIFFPLNFWEVFTGFLVLLLALTVGFSARRFMQKRNTPVNPYQTPSMLVMDGPFSYSRNPLYLMLLLVHAALAILLNSFWFIVSLGLLFIFLRYGVIKAEEQYLDGKFGDQYREYQKKVRRWF